MMEESICVTKKGRTVTITPSHLLSLSSSCPDLIKEAKASSERKLSAPVLDRGSIDSLTRCSIITTSRSKLPKQKFKMHLAILPSKKIFSTKKPPPCLVRNKTPAPSQKLEQPSEQNLSTSLPENKLQRMRKLSCELPRSPSPPATTKRGRKLSCDLTSPSYISLKSSRARKLSYDLTAATSPGSTKPNQKSFLFSLGKLKFPFTAGRWGSRPTILEEHDDMSDDSADSAGPSPVRIVVSCTGSEGVRLSADLESVRGLGVKKKISPYNKLLGKSMELLPTSSVVDSEVGPFRRETGEDGESCSVLPHHALLENPESETRWYFKYFLGKVHYNYLCYDNSKSPVFLSVVKTESAACIYRCILWRKTGNKRLCIEQGPGGKAPSPRAILEKFSGCKYERSVKEISVASIQKDLLTLEEQEGSVNFKIGVLYARAGQITDNEMFSNEHGSERFHKFVELLGDEVGLQGWQQFRGGLDNRNNSTGKTSVYTVFEGHEIMFHVSTLLPYSVGNEQQLERKRHIGNDIVVIIFVDYDTNPEDALQTALNFSPKYMRSHFNHIFALVSYDGSTDRYRLSVCSAESVPFFGPPLPCYGEFNDHTSFRDFLLAKLINGEKAAYCTPTFAEKRERTLDLLLKSVEQKCGHEYRRAVSSPSLHLVPQSPITPTNKKLFEREQSFADFGQRLKVEKIIRGHHPTSQRTTVASKKDPWHTECIVKSFPYQITYGDACDDGTLIVATQSDGTYFIYRDGSYSLIIDKSLPVAQVLVAHRHQILLLRTGFAKENNYLYAIPLKEFYTEKIKIGMKSSLSPYHIPYTKGCHLFCTAPLDGQFLRVAVAVKTKVLMLAYKHPATLTLNGSPLTPIRSPNPLDNFIKHRELSLTDVPVHMTLLDERPSGKLCVSYSKQTAVDAIDEILGTTQRVPNLDIAKGKLTTLTGTYTRGRSELLIGYNMTCQLVTINDGTAYNSVEIVWNAEPRNLVYMAPYLLAFTTNTIEIRMASNGSLMQTIHTPDLKLLSMKGDIYFSSSSAMVQNPISKVHSTSMTNLPTKFPKNIDKKDFLTSTKFDHKDMSYIYRISFEDMTGRRDSMMESLRSSVSDDSMSTRYSITEDDRSTVSPSSLDYVHPLIEDDENDVLESFGEKRVNCRDMGILAEDEEPDYDHLLDSPIMLKSLQSYQQGSPDSSTFSPIDSDYDHIAPLESVLGLKVSPRRHSIPVTHPQVGPHGRDPGSRAIRRRERITGKRPDYGTNGYGRSPGDHSPRHNRTGIVLNTTPEPGRLGKTNYGSAPEIVVQDNFASTVNTYNSSLANQSVFNSRKANAQNHS